MSGFRASDLRRGNLVREELGEGLGELLRGAGLDDAPVGQAVAQELADAPRGEEAAVRGLLAQTKLQGRLRPALLRTWSSKGCRKRRLPQRSRLVQVQAVPHD